MSYSKSKNVSVRILEQRSTAENVYHSIANVFLFLACPALFLGIGSWSEPFISVGVFCITVAVLCFVLAASRAKERMLQIEAKKAVETESSN